AGGICTSPSIYFEGDVAMPLLEMYMKGITFHSGRVNSASALPEVLDVLSTGLIDPLCIEPDIVDWADASDALLENYTKLLIRRTH
ncbi:MAG: dehydrogenase, partial [Pseudomonadota bacterium]